MAKTSSLIRSCGHDKGMILLSTVTMMALLSLLVLSLFQSIFLYAKANSHFTSNHQEFYALETVAHLLIQSKVFLKERGCFCSEPDFASALKKLKEGKGCRFLFKQENYQYYINDLKEYSCLNIRLERKIRSSHHWLLSVMNEKQQFLQLRIAWEGSGQGQCREGQAKYIPAGIISWRYLQG
ncbi:hypothetical protein [Legionella londiniensis]|uniref:Tfp pilus assembly protein PilX n=1 Tax=Legionella londiniensis TaxID=45068 RepID=A0A0W0VPW2_9GAMM|nr:hypothetical protein [Legionella londiniensis]KTD21833.1 hypothetical protein Llon_0998 [Legionella londiniensis]STX92684.1 Uncharacterised protein [Legionella londiniensis]